VPKSDVNLHEDQILFMQNTCKRLLAEAKQQQMFVYNSFFFSNFRLNRFEKKSCRILFYEDTPFIRNKNQSGFSNDVHRLFSKQKTNEIRLILFLFIGKLKSKFVLSILRCEIPEKFHVDMEFPENKHKSYIELPDGSTQI